MMLPPAGSSSRTRAAMRRLTSACRVDAGREGRLELEALDGDGAPVHPADGPALLEGGEVAADGLGGDAEGVGEAVTSTRPARRASAMIRCCRSAAYIGTPSS